MSIISPLLPPEKKSKSNQTITKEKIQKTYSSSACKKKQSKNYYEKLLTKTTTIVSSSKNHPCLGFLSSIKNMKWNTKHTKNSIYKKKYLQKNPSKSWELLTLKKNKTKLRPVLYWVKSKAESTCSAKSVVQLTTKNR